MVITCWLSRVKEVEITPKLKGFALTSCLASVPIIRVLRDREEVNPFAPYYEASRHGRIQGPHHAFANITSEEAIPPFFRKFGFPSFEGQDLLLGQVLIEAKRLRLLMEAWQAFRGEEFSVAQQLLGELEFACRFDSHWWYWPPPILHETDQAQAAVQFHRQFLDQEFKRARELAATYTTSDELYKALVSYTRNICVDPLTQVEFAPEIGVADGHRVELCWALRPVRLMGESEQYGIYEELYLGAPYGLMFLLDLNSGIETRVCADPFCRGVFGASRRNQIYCSEHCAHRMAVRNYRKRGRATAVNRSHRRM